MNVTQQTKRPHKVHNHDTPAEALRLTSPRNALYRRFWLARVHAPLHACNDLFAAIDMRTNSPRNALAFLGDKLQVGAY